MSAGETTMMIMDRRRDIGFTHKSTWGKFFFFSNDIRLMECNKKGEKVQ